MRKFIIGLFLFVIIFFSSCGFSNIDVYSRINNYLPPGSTEVTQIGRYHFSFVWDNRNWIIYIFEQGNYGTTIYVLEKKGE